MCSLFYEFCDLGDESSLYKYDFELLYQLVHNHYNKNHIGLEYAIFSVLLSSTSKNDKNKGIQKL